MAINKLIAIFLSSGCMHFINFNLSFSQSIYTLKEECIEMNNQGLDNGKNGNLPDAVSYFDIAISLCPQFADAYCNRCMAKMQLQQYDSAIVDCNKAIEIEPSATAYFNRGTTYLHQSKYLPAEKDFDKAIALNRKHAGSYRNRSIARKHLGKNKESERDIKKAWKLEEEEINKKQYIIIR